MGKYRSFSRINYHHLFYFVTIAQEGSIKQACKKLNISQSALSGQLKQLEVSLGKQLFDRKVRQLIINETGKLALKYAQSIFLQTEEMIKSVQQPQTQEVTIIRVGIIPSLSKTHIHEFVVPLWIDKSICVSITEGRLTELMRDMEDGDLEVVLSDSQIVSKRSQFKSYRLQPRQIVAVATKKFEYARENFPFSLNTLPLLQLTSQSQIRSDIDYLFEKKGIIPHVVGEADDVALLRIAAEKGIGYTILPKITVQGSLEDGHLIEIGTLNEINSYMWATLNPKTSNIAILNHVVRQFQEKRGAGKVKFRG